MDSVLGTVSGEVIHGNKRGRTIGYPTANIDVAAGALPENGIYAVRVKLGEEHFIGAASYGYNPTFKGSETARLEVHIFDFDRDIYGEILTVTFVAFLRAELKFESVEKLVRRMEMDCAEARRIFAPIF